MIDGDSRDYWWNRCRKMLTEYYDFEMLAEQFPDVYWYSAQHQKSWGLYREALGNLLYCLKN